MGGVAAAGPRLDLIQKWGFLNCGIEENVPGFSELDADGQHHAPLVRQDDPHWFVVVRWTILALINAEELGVTSS